MIRILQSLLVLLLSVALPARAATQFYVSPAGNDANPGTIDQPFQTLTQAQAAVREVNAAMTGDIFVYLRGGTYPLSGTVTFTSADSGTNGHVVTWMAYPGETPVISGGKTIAPWTLHDAVNNIWQASPGAADNSRQLYVNGLKATRARSANASGLTATATGYTTTDLTLRNYGNIANMEVVSQSSLWIQSRFPIAAISGSTISIQEPCRTTIANSGGYPTTGNPVWIENAYEYLTQAGYWYLDLGTHTLYYKPRTGENMTTATVELPVLETLFTISGSSTAPVSNLTLSGLTFRLSNWLQPSTGTGLACAQANQGDPWHVLGAFEITGGHNVTVSACTFRELGGNGINILTASQNITVDRCLFLNIAAGAVQVGQCRGADLQLQPGSPDIVTGVTISNCAIHDVCTDYMASCGIFFGWTQTCAISHNEVYNVPYTGIGLGLGWEWEIPTYTIGNQIVGNRIHDHLRTLADGGGIYVNGYQQSGTISANHICNQGNVYGAIYLDEGSANWTVTGNVVEKASAKECLFYRGPNNHFDSNYVDNSSVYTDSMNYTTTEVPSGSLPGGTSITAPSGVTNSSVITNGVWPAAAAAIMNASGPQFLVASGTFTSATGGSWGVAENWSGAAIAYGADQTADFSKLALGSDATVTLDNSYTIGNMVFGDTTAAHNWILSGSGTTLTLAVGSGNPSITVSNQVATLNVPVAGTSGLTKNGTGTLALGASNSLTGTATILGGTLSLTALSGTGTGTPATELAGTPIIVNADATLLAGATAAGQNAHKISNDLTLNGGILASNGVTGNSDYNFSFDSSGSRIVASGNATSTVSASIGLNGTHEINVGAGSTLNITGMVGNWENQQWGTLNKTGSGLLSLTYNGNNYGGLTLNGGTTSVGASAWRNASGPGYYADFEGNATLQWLGNSTDISAGSKLKIADGVTATLDTNGNNVTLGTTLVLGTAKTGALAKAGAGTLTLAASNTYGATAITGGTLQVGNGGTAGSLGTGGITDNATLAYNFSNATTLSLPSGAAITGSGNLTATAGLVQLNGNIALGGSHSYTQNGASGYYKGIEVAGASVALTGAVISMTGDVGKRSSWGNSLIMDTSAANGPINLNISIGRVGDWYGINSFTANAGTGSLTISGAYAPNAWNASNTSLTGGLNISSSGIPMGGPLTLHATAASTVSGNLSLAAGSANTMNVDSGVTMTISGQMSGTGAGLTKNGSGMLVLSGSNIYTGATMIANGTLVLGDGTNTGSVSAGAITNNGALVLNPGASGLTIGTTVSGTGTLTKIGGGTLTLSGSNTYTGATVIASGTLRLAPVANVPTGLKIMPLGDSITYGSGGTQSGYRGFLYSLLYPAASGFQFVGSSTLNATSALPTSPTDQTHHDGHPSATIQYISNNLDGFDDSNLYHGAQWSNTGGYWFTGNNGTVRPPLYPDIITLMIGTNNVGSLDGTTQDQLDALVAKITTMRPNANLIVADITPNSAPTQTGTYNSYVDAVVAKYAALGNHVSRVDLNTGFPANGLTSDNTHPNDTGYSFMANQWNTAILALYPGNATGIGSLSPVSVAAGATLDINGSQTSLSLISGAGNIALGTNGQLTVNSAPGNNSTFSGAISGTGALNLTGGGTWTLSGSCAVTGTTQVVSGLLVLDGSTGSANALIVNAGATLSGSGTIAGPATVNGTHSPGDGIGSQTFTGALVYGISSHLGWALAGNTASGPGVNFDQVIAGAVTVNAGAVIDVTLNSPGSAVNFTDAFWRSSQSWTILSGTGITGSFALGTTGNDPEGNASSNYGTFTLQQSGTAVTLLWTPFAPIVVWRNLSFGANASNPAISGDLVSPSNSGMTNLMAYALGVKPNQFNSRPMASVEGGNSLSLTYTRADAATDITLGVLWSTDLVNWSSDNIVQTVLSDDGKTQTVKAQVPMGTDARKFITLKVTHP